ncbi:hypothetical protein GCM10009030_36590 [Haloarcula pellucida]|uniref:Uncharacterized protein n=1 Tax=Haloarcula pellucida TaxID=1427151 RepID=A0A830GRH3_9EURY|nr:hypothetical protein GCM10009030_36590 [Halomicroarcula pellucida]
MVVGTVDRPRSEKTADGNRRDERSDAEDRNEALDRGERGFLAVVSAVRTSDTDESHASGEKMSSMAQS